MKLYKKLLLGSAFVGVALWKYARFVEKRSLSSLMIEKSLQLAKSKSVMNIKTKEEFDRKLKPFYITNEEPVGNPSLIINKKIEETDVDGMQLFTWNDKKDRTQKVLFYFHGGGYIGQPSIFHYITVEKIAKTLDAKVVFPIYPKLPVHTYTESYEKLTKVYNDLLKTVDDSDRITFIGDSAGGGLALGFAMYCRDNNLPQPKDIVLISPWVDIATDNPDIVDFEDTEPMLSSKVLGRLGIMWSGSTDNLKDPHVSPIYGEFNGLGKISMFVGTREIFYPDIEKLHNKLNDLGIAHNYTVGEKMNHVYILYPIPEAKMALKEIVNIIKDRSNNE